MMQLLHNSKHSHRFWLLAIAGGLIAFTWQLSQYNTVYLLFWGAALSITWRRRESLCLESSLVSTSIGLLLIAWTLIRSVLTINSTDVLTRITPLVSVLGLCLLATKASKIGQYWREIVIVSLTALPFEHLFSLLSPSTPLSVLDAKFSRLLLWYAGFDVAQTDNLVILPTGTISIAGRCSSFAGIWQLWQLCLVVFLCFSLRLPQKLLLWIWATVIAVSVNGVRLCLMAILVARNNQEAFDYWHGHSGAEIFSTIAVLLFGLAYWLLTREKKQDLSDSYEL